MKYQRGQIYYYNFDADGSHITTKNRPVVIVSHDIENENDNFDRMTVVPLTSTVSKVYERSECRLICNQTLSKAQVDMITTVKKALVGKYLAQLTIDDMVILDGTINNYLAGNFSPQYTYTPYYATPYYGYPGVVHFNPHTSWQQGAHYHA
ncbi:type II toxin-antitoxin system PemK/MazF family toxin [Solemya velum gill symbiont]|uniref:type II toxin-antitoxin system PemK/MazF family toxin n=1 Tax=Solemya velum gill symbiont TaxID=2340 RepID=UPI000996F80D|nr:type II toxin-antitoxin system PemK/MazF family toxin [Solemya velum gill symbiont]OOZ10083.1 hypothetical protein BOW25_13310 [Solemya velum gill symbiont]